MRGGNGRNLLLNLLQDSQDEPSQNNQTKLSPIEQRLAAASKLVRGSLDAALSSAFGQPNPVTEKARRTQAILNQSCDFTPANRFNKHKMNN